MPCGPSLSVEQTMKQQVVVMATSQRLEEVASNLKNQCRHHHHRQMPLLPQWNQLLNKQVDSFPTFLPFSVEKQRNSLRQWRYE